jgi:tetratricopeptide (TPR) repeat protein
VNGVTNWSVKRPWVSWAGIESFATKHEILTCPHSLLDAALEVSRTGDHDDRYGAGELIFQFGRTAVDAEIWDGGLWLKRLNEIRLMKEGITGVNQVAAFLQPRLHAAVSNALRGCNRVLEDLQSDPLGVLSEVIRHHHDPDVTVPCLLMATQTRLRLLAGNYNREEALQTLMHEARMYADGGYARDAADTAEIGVRSFRRNEVREPARHEAGHSLLATASTCADLGELDTARTLFQVGLEQCSPSCGHYAMSLAEFANGYEKAGDLAEAVRLLEKANRPEVMKDNVAKQLIPYGLSVMKMLLTGDARQVVTDVEAVAAELGGSAESLQIFRAHLAKLQAGQKLTDKDLVEGAREFAACARYNRNCGGIADRTVEPYCAALRLLLSMRCFAEQVEFASELLSEATQALEGTTQPVQQQLESLGHLVQPACSAIRGVATNDVAALQVGRESSEQTNVSTLRTLLLEKVVDVARTGESVSTQQLTSWIENATSLASILREAAPTAESSLPYRSEFDAIARCLTLFALRNLGCSDLQIAEFQKQNPLARFSLTVERDDSESGVWEMVDTLRVFYVAISDWLVAGYAMRRLSDCLATLGTEERFDFAEARERFSQSIDQYADDLLLLEDLEDWHGKLPKIISELQVKRSLASGDLSVRATGGDAELLRSECSDEECLAILVPMFPNTHDDATLTLILFESDRMHVWARETRSRLWYRAARMVAAQNSDAFFHEIDDVVQETMPSAGLCLDSLSRRIMTVGIVDLSSENVPLSLLEDDDERFAFTNGLSYGISADGGTCPRISYWGLTGENEASVSSVDDEARCIFCDTKHGSLALRYPRVPGPNELQFSRKPAPLVLGHYERWDFECHTAAGRCSIDFHLRTQASRSNFLERDWGQVDVLHISAHAHAIAHTPEFGHFDLSRDKGEPGALHSFDILSLDLTGLQLVFLSACQTKLGSQWTGNEDLSLAWAFRAAGAASVIAMRWEVSEAAAWYFSNRFYDAWLGNTGLPLRQAFRAAQKAVRDHSMFSEPNLWGAFVLVE